MQLAHDGLQKRAGDQLRRWRTAFTEHRPYGLLEAHIQRLHRGLRESIDTSSIHLDLLSDLKRINSQLANIAHPILMRARQPE
jgi:Na+/phosphate symporter